MIRKAKLSDIEDVADIWLEANIKAHDFIDEDYWRDRFEAVKELLAQAELYVYAADAPDQEAICGFIGMSGDHIEGIFVKETEQSRGIGKALIDHVKSIKGRLTLNVYRKNRRALKFYEKEGFIIQGESTEPETGEKDLFMEWKNDALWNRDAVSDKDVKIEYDDEYFFRQYAEMSRSRNGLAGAGEWHQMKRLFPDLAGRRVLDLGCGYGWHCNYAVLQGAEEVLGIDISERMIRAAVERNSDSKILYRLCGLEEYEYPKENWDLVISNLALHYIADLDAVYQKVYHTLKPGGKFLFNIEHTVFTSGVRQEWVCDDAGKPLYWPIDDYFYPGERSTQFLGCEVKKQHHTLTQILGGLIACGFDIEKVEEALPSEEMMEIPGIKDEMRRPMMLMVRAGKEKRQTAIR